tara:strand:- start:1623 stop:2246 length:624 start_codon:yes stop_codon:yes gene_type:complete
MAKFITLAGRKQVGKDTSAEYIKLALGSDRVHIVHFADALKQACSIIFGIPLEDMETETGKQKLTQVHWPDRLRVQLEEAGEREVWTPDGHSDFMTVREVLQFVGTNLFRNQLDPDIWVQSVYRKKYRDDDIVVVADCRFPNECDFAKSQGVLISVERETGLASDGHASETALDSYTNYDHVIDNNGSFDELRRKLNTILTGSSLTV